MRIYIINYFDFYTFTNIQCKQWSRFLDSGRLGMLAGIRNVQGCEMRELTSSDDEGWQEREASRTHSVKFTDEPPEADKEVRSLS